MHVLLNFKRLLREWRGGDPQSCEEMISTKTTSTAEEDVAASKWVPDYGNN